MVVGTVPVLLVVVLVILGVKAILDRVPWHTEETTVVVAPMFHAWGFSQLVFAASLGCTVVTRRINLHQVFAEALSGGSGSVPQSDEIQ